MSAALLDGDAQVASLDVVRGRLVADARSWAVQLGELAALAARAERAGARTRRTLSLELAGSWQVGQLTAERWVAEAERFHDALPLTLAMLRAGTLLRHQAQVLLHRTMSCTAEVAAAVEEQVLPFGAGLCPSDLSRRVDRVRLRIEAEQADAVGEAERREAQKVASRRTFARTTEDDMAVVGAVLTPEQGRAWAAGLDLLERRERLADRAAGRERTAEQRRADLFAALPALVLAGPSQDDRWRRASGGTSGGRVQAPRPDGGAASCDEPDDSGPAPPPWTFDPEQVAAQVVLNVHVPCSTVLDLSQEPGTLDRYGPVGAQHVRMLRPHSFRPVMVDAVTGRPLAVDDKTTPAADTEQGRRGQVQQMLRPDVITDVEEPQHDPSARLARLIDWRDPALRRTRMLQLALRPRPPGALARRLDQRLQPRPPVAPLPQREAPRLDTGAAPRRQPHLDEPTASHVHPTGPLEPATGGRPQRRTAASTAASRRAGGRG